MINFHFTDEILCCDKAMDQTLLRDMQTPQSSQTASQFWEFGSCCVTEAFSIIRNLDNIGKVLASGDAIANSLEQAEEDIARGFRTLAVLLADSNNRDEWRAEFQERGIVDPLKNHLAFRIGKDPNLIKQFNEIFHQNRLGRSNSQIRNFMRQVLSQSDRLE